MMKNSTLLGGLVSTISAGLNVLDAFVTNQLPPGPPPAPKKKRAAPPRARRYRREARPNTVHGAVHNGTAFVYCQEKATARRVRQREVLFQKALDRLPPGHPADAAEFG